MFRCAVGNELGLYQYLLNPLPTSANTVEIDQENLSYADDAAVVGPAAGDEDVVVVAAAAAAAAAAARCRSLCGLTTFEQLLCSVSGSRGSRYPCVLNRSSQPEPPLVVE